MIVSETQVFFYKRPFFLKQIVVSEITHTKSLIKLFHVARFINKDLITIFSYRELVNNHLKNQKKRKTKVSKEVLTVQFKTF